MVHSRKAITSSALASYSLRRKQSNTVDSWGGGEKNPSLVESRVKRFVKCHHGVEPHLVAPMYRYAIAHVLYYRGWSDRQIGSLLHKAPSTIKSYRQAALGYLPRHVKFKRYLSELQQYLECGWYRDVIV